MFSDCDLITKSGSKKEIVQVNFFIGMAVCLVEYNEPRMPAGIAKAKAIEAKFVTPGL